MNQTFQTPPRHPRPAAVRKYVALVTRIFTIEVNCESAKNSPSPRGQNRGAADRTTNVAPDRSQTQSNQVKVVGLAQWLLKIGYSLELGCWCLELLPFKGRRPKNSDFWLLPPDFWTLDLLPFRLLACQSSLKFGLIHCVQSTDA